MKMFIDLDGDICRTAGAIAAGTICGQPFANLYPIASRPDAVTVRRVNLMKGRPAHQVGSILTTWRHFPTLFDWARLPEGLDSETVVALIDRLFAIGPFGFRGPAAGHIPDHLASRDGGIRTTQLIAPGTACPSNALIDAAMAAGGTRFLYVTSANRSRHATGGEEPAHWRARGLAADFGHEPDFILLRHHDEAAARARFPLHAPTSTTILAFHRLGQPDAAGRPTLVVERHGSLGLADLAPIVAEWGFGLETGPGAGARVPRRTYPDALPD